MKEAPYYCPLCNRVLTCQGRSSIETPTESTSMFDRHVCSHHDYACSVLNPDLSYLGADFSEIFIIGTHEEMFQTGCVAIRVFYLNGNILTHQIDTSFIHKKPFRIRLKLNDEIFMQVFSRNDLHPLLEKVEKYEVFS